MPAARATAAERRGQRLAAVAAFSEVLGAGESDLVDDETNDDEMMRELNVICSQVSS
jgi:hypothetical protein